MLHRCPGSGPKTKRAAARSEGGFALILAILALMLLTFLGLTLAVTTTTEMQIANNYRTSQEALYVAEAGIEAGKALLTTMEWSTILPTRRTTTWTGSAPPGATPAPPFSRNDQWARPSRNYENRACDRKFNGVGYGVVLDDGGAGAPYQYKMNLFGQPLSGAVTLWVRRPLEYKGDGMLTDWPYDEDNLILVAEGVVPFSGALVGARRIANRAVRVIEVSLSRVPQRGPGRCGSGSRPGQTGLGQLGANLDTCANITGAQIVKGIGPEATEPGTEFNPGQ